LIKLKVQQISYSDIILVIKDLINSKNACADVLEKDAFGYLNEETKK
jgi:hypothetical protein